MLIILNLAVIFMVYVDKKIYKTFLTPFTVVALTFLLMIDLNNLIVSDIYGYYKVSDFSILVLLGFIAVVFAVACLFGYFWYAPKCRVAVKPKFDIEKRINYKFVIIIFLIGLAAYFISLLRDISAYGFGNLKGKASGIFAHLSQLAFLIAPLLWSYSKSIKSKIISFCLIALTFFMAFLYGGKYGILINFVYIMMYMLIRKNSNVKRILKYIAVIGFVGLGVFIVVYAVIPSFTSSGADNSSSLGFSIEHFFYYLLSPIIANNHCFTHPDASDSNIPFTVIINIGKALSGDKNYVNPIFDPDFACGQDRVTNVSGLFGEVVYCLGWGGILYIIVLFALIYIIFVMFKLKGMYKLTLSYLLSSLLFSFFCNFYTVSGVVLPIMFLFAFETYFQLIRGKSDAKRVSNNNAKLERLAGHDRMS